MGISERRRPSLRLTEDQQQRLGRAAKGRGQTKQGFIQAAVLSEIKRFEEEDDKRRARGSNASRSRRSEEPEGLGLGLRRTSLSSEMHELQAPNPVVVNVGGTPAQDDFITRLADYVMSATVFEREARVGRAVEILRGSAKTEEEGRVMAGRLDAALASRSKEAPSVLKRFRSHGESFGKLKALLGG